MLRQFLFATVLLVALAACAPTPAPIATSAPTLAPTAFAMSTLAPTATPTLTSTPLPTLTSTITPTPAPDASAALALARTQIKNFNDKDFSVSATWLADKRALVVIQSKTTPDAWVLLPGAKEFAILILSDAGWSYRNVGWDEQNKTFTAENARGEKVYYALWLPKFSIDQLWTKNPLAPPPEKVLNAKTDAEMMQAAVESLNPGPEFVVIYANTKKPDGKVFFKDALLLAIKRHEKTDLKLPDFPLPADTPLEFANAPDVAIDLGGLSMKKVFAAYIGEVGALGPESDQMARAQYDPTTHRYRLLVNVAVLKPAYMGSIDNSIISGVDPSAARIILAFAYRASCEAIAKEMINQDPGLERRLVSTLAFCNVFYHDRMAGSVNNVDMSAGQSTPGEPKLALKLWREGNWNLIAQRIIYSFTENVNQRLLEWKTATAPRLDR